MRKWRQFHPSPDSSTCKKPNNAHFLQAAVRAKIGGHKVAQRIAQVACGFFVAYANAVLTIQLLNPKRHVNNPHSQKMRKKAAKGYQTADTHFFDDIR